MKRRTLVLLAALWAAVLIVFCTTEEARADRVYRDVYIYGFSWPVAGESVVDHREALYIPEDCPYIFNENWNREWHGYWGPDGYVSTQNQGTFDAADNYTLTFYVYATGVPEGDTVITRPHVFDRVTGDEITDLLGMKPTSASSGNMDGKVLFNLSTEEFDSTRPPAIDRIALRGFEWPIAGVQAISNYNGIAVDGFAHYTVQSRTWYTVSADGTETAFYGAFVDGQKYRLKITLRADNYYAFTSVVDATMDGYEAAAESGPSDYTKTVVTIDAVARNPILLDQAHFPNNAFRAFISSTYDTNGNGVLAWDEYRDVTRMNASNIGAGSLTGIQYFLHLTSLNASGNLFYTVDLSGNPSLQELILEDNPNLYTLDVSSLSRLKILRVSGCGLHSAPDLSHNPELRDFYCANMGLTSLDVSDNGKLDRLDCSHNALTALDVTDNPLLTTLRCNSNRLLALDLSGNTQLKTLECQHNETEAEMRYRVDVSACTPLVNCVVNGSYTQGHDAEGYYDLYTTSGARLKHTTFSTRVVIGGDPAVIAFNFPDAAFRAYVKQRFDTNGDNRLSAGEIGAAKTLSVANAGIEDLKGIEYLTALQTLNAAGNALTSVDLSANTKLVTIDLSDNDLTSIDTWYQTDLKTLYIQDNNISYPHFNNNINLETLYCYNNSIGTLSVSYNAKLSELIAYNAGIHSTLFATNSQLFEVDLTGNDLNSLSLQRCPLLQTIVGDGAREHYAQAGYYRYDGPDGGYLLIDDDVELTGGGLIPLNAEYFRDDNLRAHLTANAGEDWAFDRNGDGMLSPSEIARIDELEICSEDIEDLTGLEYLAQLTYLNIDGNPVSGAFDITPFPILTDLYIDDTGIDELIFDESCSVSMLGCANTAMTDMTWLAELPNLRALDMSYQSPGYDWSFL